MKQESFPTKRDYVEGVIVVAVAMLIGPFIVPSATYALFIEVWLYIFHHFFPALCEPFYLTMCALCPGYTFGGSFGMPVILKC